MTNVQGNQHFYYVNYQVVQYSSDGYSTCLWFNLLLHAILWSGLCWVLCVCSMSNTALPNILWPNDIGQVLCVASVHNDCSKSHWLLMTWWLFTLYVACAVDCAPETCRPSGISVSRSILCNFFNTVNTIPVFPSIIPLKSFELHTCHLHPWIHGQKLPI